MRLVTGLRLDPLVELKRSPDLEAVNRGEGREKGGKGRRGEKEGKGEERGVSEGKERGCPPSVGN